MRNASPEGHEKKAKTFKWVITHGLMRGRRPGVELKRGSQVPKSVVDRWIETARKEFGIRSIICLLDDHQLKFYEKVRMDLAGYYNSRHGCPHQRPQYAEAPAFRPSPKRSMGRVPPLAETSAYSLQRWNWPYRSGSPLLETAKWRSYSFTSLTPQEPPARPKYYQHKKTLATWHLRSE